MEPSAFGCPMSCSRGTRKPRSLAPRAGRARSEGAAPPGMEFLGPSGSARRGNWRDIPPSPSPPRRREARGGCVRTGAPRRRGSPGRRGGGGGREIEAVVLEGCLTGTHLVTVEAGDPAPAWALISNWATTAPVSFRWQFAHSPLARICSGERSAIPGRARWRSTAAATSTPAIPTTTTTSRKRMPENATEPLVRINSLW